MPQPLRSSETARRFTSSAKRRGSSTSSKMQQKNNTPAVSQPAQGVKLKRLVSIAREIAEPYCVREGKKFRLKDVDPGDTAGYTSEDKPRARQALQTGVQALS